MITIKTLLHSLKAERVEGADMCLSLYLNDGWEILNIACKPETSELWAERIVTLKFESRDIEPLPLFGVYTQGMMKAPSLPQDIVKAWRFAMLKRKQNSEFVFEADDELVAELGKILPAPTFTDEELES